MKSELPGPGSLPDRTRELARRLASRPELAERVHQILDTLDASVAEGCTADEAEERVITQMRQLGQTLLQQWANAANAQLQERAKRSQPTAVKEGKKNG